MFQSTIEWYSDMEQYELLDSALDLEYKLDKMREEGWYTGDQYVQDTWEEFDYVKDLLEEKFDVPY